MIAAVTDLGGRITGAHRTWLDRDGFDPVRLGKAPIDSPRRAMGNLLGNAVRFGIAHDVAAAGEGIETVLSLRCVLPDMPMKAALSARASRGHPVSGNAAPALCRSRQRSGWRTAQWLVSSAEPTRHGSTRSPCRPRATTSTLIYVASASMRCGRQCGYSLSRRTSRASCLCEVWPERVSVGPARCRRVRNVRALPSERTAPAAFLRGRPCGKRPGPAMAAAGYFPPRARRMGLHIFIHRATARFASGSKISVLRHPPLRSGRCAVQVRSARRVLSS